MSMLFYNIIPLKLLSNRFKTDIVVPISAHGAIFCAVLFFKKGNYYSDGP